MYILTNVSEGQLPCCYYGFFKVIDKNAIDEPTIWDITGNIRSSNGKPFLNVNGHHFEGEVIGNTVSMTTDDRSLILFMTDVPNKSSIINPDKFSNNCANCFSIMLTDINSAKNYIATSGNYFVIGKEIKFDILVKELSDFVEGTGKSYAVKGAFFLEE